MEFEEAREQLQFAREHLESVRNIKSHAEFRKWWQAFRTCITTACNSADNILYKLGCDKESPVRQPINFLRSKRNPETQYLIHARNASFHKVDPVSEVEPGLIEMSPGGPVEGVEMPDGTTRIPAGTLLRIKMKSPAVKLLPVTSRKVTYPVPLSGPEFCDDVHSAVSLGEVSISQVQDALDRVGALIAKRPKS